MRIHCPFCGVRDHAEFAYGGDAAAYPALDAAAEEWHEAVFLRENVRGVQSETWQHISGCRMWLLVQRDTLSHEIHSVRPANVALAAALEKEAAALKNETAALAEEEK